MDLLSLLDAGPAAPSAPPAPGSTTSAPLLLRAAPSPPPFRRAGRVPARQRPTLLAVDGDSLAHRAFHAYGSDARYGVLALLAGIADQVPFSAVVVGFDAPRATSWRRRRWPGYKAQRPPKPSELVSLLAELPALLAERGNCVVCADGQEADDVLGSAAAVAAGEGWCSVLATSDRDAYGLVDEETTVLRLRSGLDNALAVTPAVIHRTLGIRAGQYVMFAALRGDASDNLPGIPGIGPSRAAALLSAYPTIEAAVDDVIGCRSVLGPELGQALIEDWRGEGSVVRRNLELMTIRRDVPVELDRCGQRLGSQEIVARLGARGLGTVAGRVAAAFGSRPNAAPPPPEPPPPGDPSS